MNRGQFFSVPLWRIDRAIPRPIASRHSPFPADFESHPRLERAGETYYAFRAELMQRNDEGLTKTYNSFHDPGERDPDILKLRELHAAMDRAVLDAYGWGDIPTDCDFLLDYEIDRGRVGQKEKALALPLARRSSRRSAGAPARAQRRARKRRGALRSVRCPQEAWEESDSPLPSSIRHEGPFLMTTQSEGKAPLTSLEVRGRLVEAVTLDLVGPTAEHALAEERLPGWVKPSNWYLTGFLMPAGSPPAKRADADEDDDFGTRSRVSRSLGRIERRAQGRQEGVLSLSMGLSFLVPKEANGITVTVRWGEYTQTETNDADRKPVSVWQRRSREEPVPVTLKGTSQAEVQDVPGSGGLQLHIVERPIAVADLDQHIPQGNSLGLGFSGEPPQGR